MIDTTKNNSQYQYPTAQAYKICVSGAADIVHCGAGSEEKARALGAAIAASGAILIDGATTGFPLLASQGAKEAGGRVIGFSPAASRRQHVHTYRLPTAWHDLIMYTGFGYSGRDILLTQSSDAVVVGCGRIGTFHEFTTAFEDRKPIGVLEGPWATDDIIKEIIAKAPGENVTVIFDSDPVALLQKLIPLIHAYRARGIRETETQAVEEIRDVRSQ
jgi:hypothetical protein